jgi:hypothetical protein
MTEEMAAAARAKKNSPPVIEVARPLPPRPAPIEHKMVKQKSKGKDFWVCSGCQYSTYNASSAREHDNER